MEYLLHLDRELLLLVNRGCSGFLDSVMLFFSQIKVWFPLYAIVAFLFFIPLWYSRKSLVFKRHISIPIWLMGLVSIVLVALNCVATDQIANLFKSGIQRPRPCSDPIIGLFVRNISGASGYGFYSGHAANVFGFAIITSLIFRRKAYPWIIFIWAAIVSYSRIYLGAHYPLDVLTGICAGLLTGYIFYLIWQWVILCLNRLYRRRRRR